MKINNIALFTHTTCSFVIVFVWSDKNLARFESYLSNKKQYTHVCKSNNTGLKFATCSLFKDLFLNRLLVVYVNVLPEASRLLDPIMFADDTKLSFNHKDTKHL